MTRHHWLRLATLVTIAGAAVAGCTSPDDPEPEPEPTSTVSPTALVPGACLQDETVTDGVVVISEEGVVPCEEEHVLELLAMQDVPREFLDTGAATPDDRVRLQRAIDGTARTSIQVKFQSFARAYCAATLQRAVGLSDTELKGKSAAELQVVPHSERSAPVALLNTGDAWVEQPLLICVNRFSEESANPAQAPTSPVTTAQTPLMFSDELPLEQRTCVAVDAAGVLAPVSCERPHYGERTVDFDATPLFDAEQIAAESEDAGAPFSDDFQAEIDEACNDVLSVVIGDDYDADDLVGRGVRGPLGWGEGGHLNTVECLVTAADPAAFDLPGGSVIGAGDADIELVEIA